MIKTLLRLIGFEFAKALPALISWGVAEVRDYIKRRKAIECATKNPDVSMSEHFGHGVRDDSNSITFPDAETGAASDRMEKSKSSD